MPFFLTVFYPLLSILMDNDGIRIRNGNRNRNEDNGIIGNKDNDSFGIEDNNREMLNEYLLEQMRLEDAGGEDDDEVSVGDGSGGGGGVDNAEAVDGINEAVAVDGVAVMDEAVGPPLLPDELIDVTIIFPDGADANADGLLSGSDLINTHVAESTRTQYNRDNADFMIYLWDKRPELLCIPAMEMLNRACVSVQRSFFKSAKAFDKTVVRNMNKAGAVIVSNPEHYPVDLDNLNTGLWN
jgi:hypothetical protein